MRSLTGDSTRVSSRVISEQLRKYFEIFSVTKTLFEQMDLQQYVSSSCERECPSLSELRHSEQVCCSHLWSFSREPTQILTVPRSPLSQHHYSPPAPPPPHVFFSDSSFSSSVSSSSSFSWVWSKSSFSCHLHFFSSFWRIDVKRNCQWVSSQSCIHGTHARTMPQSAHTTTRRPYATVPSRQRPLSR